MSTAKYSGIAVAAANRAALARQEAEAERASSVRQVDAKEMALLQHLRKTMTAESILGAGEKSSATTTKMGDEERRVHEAAASGRTETDATRSPRVGLSGDGVDDDGEKEEEARIPPREKRHMSKAERKRLKRNRSRGVEEAPPNKKRSSIVDQTDEQTEKNGERRAKKMKKTKKEKKKSSTLGPVARPRA